jgi:hypothetical protein
MHITESWDLEQFNAVSSDGKMRDSKEILHGISTTSLDLPAVLASPDSNRFPLHSKLARKHSKRN